MPDLWGANPPDSNALKSHIYALRKQLELAGAPDMIITIPQLGYRPDFTGISPPVFYAAYSSTSSGYAP